MMAHIPASRSASALDGIVSDDLRGRAVGTPDGVVPVDVATGSVRGMVPTTRTISGPRDGASTMITNRTERRGEAVATSSSGLGG